MSFLYEPSQQLLHRVRHIRFLKKNHSIDLSKVGIWENLLCLGLGSLRFWFGFNRIFGFMNFSPIQVL